MDRMLERSEDWKEATLHSKEATTDRKSELYDLFTSKNDKVNDTSKRIDNHIAINDAMTQGKSIDNISQRVSLKTDLLEDKEESKVETTQEDSKDDGRASNDFFTDSDGNI